jgi:hypothetical protein
MQTFLPGTLTIPSGHLTPSGRSVMQARRAAVRRIMDRTGFDEKSLRRGSMSEFPEELQDAPRSVRSFHVKAKGIATVLTAITALVAACTALIKTMDTSLQQKSYEALAEAIKENADIDQRQSEDLKALQKYLEEDRSARKQVADTVSSAAASASAAPARPPTSKKPPPAPPVPVPPAPPAVGTGSRPAPPPDFNSVVNQSRM